MVSHGLKFAKILSFQVEHVTWKLFIWGYWCENSSYFHNI